MILPDGKLRHFMKNPDDADDFHERDNEEFTPFYYDHEPGQYCMEKVNQLINHLFIFTGWVRGKAEVLTFFNIKFRRVIK